jgi:hypothetical protein
MKNHHFCEEIIMTVNEGYLDRALRIIIGLLLIGLAIFKIDLWGWTVGIWGWVGVVPLATGLIGWCPAYSLLGINSCATKKTVW